MTFDVIIVGASFAGLAVATQLRGKRVLLLDHKPIGTGQTSACGTLVSTLQALGLEEAILQVHNQIVVHTPSRTFVYPMQKPFCTFDYAMLCRRLHEQSGAEFVQAAALGIQGNRVLTTQGVFAGDLIVDASGWRAALGHQVAPDRVRLNRLNFGIETTVAYVDDGLHFWYDPRGLLPMGVAWAFPMGAFSRIGVASYWGDTRLGFGLDRFLNDRGVRRDRLHGGYFPHALRVPLVGNLFLVGDAAGQCLGLTGEGIRPALFFGTHLGCLLHRVLKGEISLNEARATYRGLVEARRPGYELLCLAQRVLPRLPLPFVQGLMAFIRQPAVLDRVLSFYVRTFWVEVAQASARQA